MPDITLDSLGSAAEVARKNRERGSNPLDNILEALGSYPGLVSAAQSFGIPAGAVRGVDQGMQPLFEEAGKLQHYGEPYFNAGPSTQAALGATVAPMVGPAETLATLGSGAIRRVRPGIGHNQPPVDAPFPQYAEQYPPIGPGTWVEQTDPKKLAKGDIGYTEKTLTPEAKQFAKAREKIMKDMDEKGYTPYFDPAKRTYVDPANYPAANVDTTTVRPSKPATVAEYLKTIDAPETSKALEAAYEHGKKLGGGAPGVMGSTEHWYAMGQLENEYIKELGPAAGRKAFLDEFAVPMAATTSGNQPQANFLMGQYLEHLRKTGQPMPFGGYQLPVTVGGRRVASNLETYEPMRAGGGYTYLGKDQPKMHNFVRSFLGDLSHPVMDEQMAGGMLAHATDPKFADRARKGAFGLLEAPVNALAQRLGIQPGNVQDVAWAGFKNEAGGPMIKVINDVIERTHRLTGMPREEIVRRGLVRKEIPVYSGAAPVPTLSTLGDNNQ